MAAAFIIGFTLVSVFFSKDLTTIETMASEKTTVTLPDNSTAQLNSKSEISYSEKKWDKKRTVNLKGEAYFKVAKGSKFDVKTTAGIVSVHGTQFNVKNRKNYFEVKCFEGLVGVEIDGDIARYATLGNNRVSTLPFDGEIYEIYMRPEYQGVGLGSRLFLAARNELQRRGLAGATVWVLADNEQAICFYENAGGRAVAKGSENFDGEALVKLAYAWD